MLSCLVGRERTASELTEETYGVTRHSPSYHTYYMKVSRTVKTLQRRGYIATRIFGRDKPYRLTPYAAARIMDSVAQAGKTEKTGKTEEVLPSRDILAYVSATCLALANIAFVATASSPWLSTPPTILTYSAFLVLSGYCLARLSIAVEKVS